MSTMKQFRVKVSSQVIGYAVVSARDLASAERKIARGEEQEVKWEDDGLNRVDYIYWSSLKEVTDK